MIVTRIVSSSGLNAKKRDALDKQIRILDYDSARERFLIAIEDEPRDEPRLVIVSDWRQAPNGSAPAGK